MRFALNTLVLRRTFSRQPQNLTEDTGWLYDEEAPDNKGTQYVDEQCVYDFTYT